jgi:hypothetical protein
MFFEDAPSVGCDERRRRTRDRRELINERLPSMDHVEVLLILYGAPTVDHDPISLIGATRLAPAILQRVVRLRPQPDP